MLVDAADDTARGCYIIMLYNNNIIITILFQVGHNGVDNIPVVIQGCINAALHIVGGFLIKTPWP